MKSIISETQLNDDELMNVKKNGWSMQERENLLDVMWTVM